MTDEKIITAEEILDDMITKMKHKIDHPYDDMSDEHLLQLYKKKDYRDYLGEYYNQRDMWKKDNATTRRLCNCPDPRVEKLQQYTREYMSIQKKLEEIPEDRTFSRDLLEYQKQQLLEKVSKLSKGG